MPEQRQAPELHIPQRPQLTEVDPDEWRRMPPDLEEKITRNLELIYQHVARLEHEIARYQDWRAGDL